MGMKPILKKTKATKKITKQLYISMWKSRLRLYLLYIRKAWVSCAVTACLSNTAEAVLSCLETKLVAVTKPWALSAQTNNEAVSVPDTFGIIFYFFNKMNCHQWKIIYHSWALVVRKYCLSKPFCQEKFSTFVQGGKCPPWSNRPSDIWDGQWGWARIGHLSDEYTFLSSN